MAALKRTLTCRTGERVEGSVLERHQEIDDENQKMGAQTVKLLVRSVRCQSVD